MDGIIHRHAGQQFLDGMGHELFDVIRVRLPLYDDTRIIVLHNFQIPDLAMSQRIDTTSEFTFR